MEKKDPLALHEPNGEALARGYLRGAAVRWNGGEGAELGIVIGHDVEGDPMVVFPTHDRSCADAISMDPTKARLALLRPAPPAPPIVDEALATMLRFGSPDPEAPETPIAAATRLVDALRAARAQYERIAEALGASPASDLAGYARDLATTARSFESEAARRRENEIAIAGDRSFVLRILMALEIAPGTLSEDQILARLRDRINAAPAPAPRRKPREEARAAFHAGAEWGSSHPEAAADLLDALERAGLET